MGNEGETKRCLVALRFTQAELDAIDAVCKAHDLTRSDLIRNALFREIDRTDHVAPAVLE